MSNRMVDLFVLDMLISIDRINRASEELSDGGALWQDEFLCGSILRDMAIIGEALNRVLRAQDLAMHFKPYWRDIVGFRNIVIHEYFGLSYDEVYRIIKEDLPLFENDILSLLRYLWKEESMQQAFAEALNDLYAMRRTESVAYLTHLKETLDKKQQERPI